MAWTLVQESAAPGTNTTSAADTPSLPGGSAAGSLLVAFVTSVDASDVITGPSGWVKSVQGTQASAGMASIWHYLDNPGGISSGTWTDSNTQLADAWMAEFTTSGVASASLSRTGTGAVTTGTTDPITAGGTSAAGDLAVACWIEASFGGSWNTPSGWVMVGSDALTSNGFGMCACLLSTSAGTVSVTGSSTASATAWAGALATFHAAPAAPAQPPKPVLLNQAVMTAATW